MKDDTGQCSCTGGYPSPDCAVHGVKPEHITLHKHLKATAPDYLKNFTQLLSALMVDEILAARRAALTPCTPTDDLMDAARRDVAENEKKRKQEQP